MMKFQGLKDLVAGSAGELCCYDYFGRVPSTISLVCPVSSHFGCLSRVQQEEIMRAIRKRDTDAVSSGEANSKAQRLPTLEVNQSTEYICGLCSKEGNVCFGCEAPAIDIVDGVPRMTSIIPHENETNIPGADIKETVLLAPGELLYRCSTCKRPAHYAHLLKPDIHFAETSRFEIATHYQSGTTWKCHDCASFTYPLDKILAWRPYPSTAKVANVSANDTAAIKSPLAREYLVKWVERSYRRTSWVPHLWLVAKSLAKLKNFLKSGPAVPLLASPFTEQEKQDIVDIMPFEVSIHDEGHEPVEEELGPVAPLLDAENRIPRAWITVDRVLDVLFWHPNQRHHINTSRSKKSRKARVQKSSVKHAVINSDSEMDSLSEDDERAAQERARIFRFGEPPSDDSVETASQLMHRKNIENVGDHISRVIWIFVKWDDLGYEEGL